MARSKLKFQTSVGKTAKLGASASSKSPSPLLPKGAVGAKPKKDYSKKKPMEGLISNANFGQTGLTGES